MPRERVGLCISMSALGLSRYEYLYRVSQHPREHSLRDFLGYAWEGEESESGDEANMRVVCLCCLDPRAAGPDRDRPAGVAAPVLISA